MTHVVSFAKSIFTRFSLTFFLCFWALILSFLLVLLSLFFSCLSLPLSLPSLLANSIKKEAWEKKQMVKTNKWYYSKKETNKNHIPKEILTDYISHHPHNWPMRRGLPLFVFAVTQTIKFTLLYTTIQVHCNAHWNMHDQLQARR